MTAVSLPQGGQQNFVPHVTKLRRFALLFLSQHLSLLPLTMSERIATVSRTTSLSRPIRLRPVASLFPEPLPEDYTFLSDVAFDKQICIRHPAYDDGDDILLVLPAQDHADGGIHYGLVITACHIIANNQDGSLTASRTGAPIDADLDDVLYAGDYYYHVPPLCT
jgi:hypothetical protein